MAIILGHGCLQTREVWVVGSRYRYPVADRVTTNNEATSMNTCSSHGALEHLGIFDGVALAYIRREFCLLQFGGVLDGIGQIHLRSIRQSVRNRLTKGIRPVEWQFLHTRHILDGVLGGHTAIGDDMGTILVSILIHHPSQHLASTIVIEVGINIRQVDTVRIQETLKQQVIFQRVNLGNAQAISHDRTCRRTTARTYHDTQLLAGSPDKVGHDEEVARETHGLHHMKLEVDMLVDIGRKRVAIEFLGSLVSKVAQVLCLKLDAVYFVVASQTVDYFLSFLGREWILPILIGGELMIEFLLGNSLTQLLLGTEALRNGEKGIMGPWSML